MNPHAPRCTPFLARLVLLLSALLASAPSLLAQADSPLAPQASVADPADIGGSLLRLLGAFLLVVALFLGGIWMFRRWQQSARSQRNGARLRVMDVQSLGGRQAIYVVAYEQQRWLVGASASGLTLLSQLPDATQGDEAAAPSGPASFAAALQELLSRRAA